MRGPTASLAGCFRGVAAVLVGALIFVASLVAITAYRPTVTIKMDTDLSTVTHGFYSAEVSENLNYAWTRPLAEFSVPDLDRHVAWRWTGRALVWRPPGVPLPHVRIAVDGVVAFDRTLDQ